MSVLDLAKAISTSSSKIRAYAIGNTLTGYTWDGSVWTQRLQRTDNTFTAAGYIAFEIFGSTTALDDFGGGNLPATVVSDTPFVFSGRGAC